MVANIEGFAGFKKRNRRSCEIFYEEATTAGNTSVIYGIGYPVMYHQVLT